jgi:hypothetical protein
MNMGYIVVPPLVHVDPSIIDLLLEGLLEHKRRVETVRPLLYLLKKRLQWRLEIKIEVVALVSTVVADFSSGVFLHQIIAVPLDQVYIYIESVDREE